MWKRGELREEKGDLINAKKQKKARKVLMKSANDADEAFRRLRSRPLERAMVLEVPKDLRVERKRALPAHV